jgi:hypothetical protein
VQGDEYHEVGQAVRDARVDDLRVSDAESLLLDYVATLTMPADRITDAPVEGLPRGGWTDEQIAEPRPTRRASTSSCACRTRSTSTRCR